MGVYFSQVAGLPQKSCSNRTEDALGPRTALISFRLWIFWKEFVFTQFLTRQDTKWILFLRSQLKGDPRLNLKLNPHFEDELIKICFRILPNSRFFKCTSYHKKVFSKRIISLVVFISIKKDRREERFHFHVSKGPEVLASRVLPSGRNRIQWETLVSSFSRFFSGLLFTPGSCPALPSYGSFLGSDIKLPWLMNKSMLTSPGAPGNGNSAGVFLNLALLPVPWTPPFPQTRTPHTGRNGSLISSSLATTHI